MVIDSSADAPRDARLLSPTFVYRDINQIPGTGQSLSVGARGNPALAVMQPFDNRMFVTGVIAGGAGLTSLVPLVEDTNEILSSSFASLITKLARDVVLVGQPAGSTTGASTSIRPCPERSGAAGNRSRCRWLSLS